MLLSGGRRQGQEGRGIVTFRKHSSLHDKWHPRVEGHIRDCLRSHPEWFNQEAKSFKKNFVNSLAKRIVGEIVADVELVTEQRDPAGYVGSR